MFLYLITIDELVPFLVKWLRCRATRTEIHQSICMAIHASPRECQMNVSCAMTETSY